MVGAMPAVGMCRVVGPGLSTVTQRLPSTPVLWQPAVCSLLATAVCLDALFAWIKAWRMHACQLGWPCFALLSACSIQLGAWPATGGEFSALLH